MMKIDYKSHSGNVEVQYCSSNIIVYKLYSGVRSISDHARDKRNSVKINKERTIVRLENQPTYRSQISKKIKKKLQIHDKKWYTHR